MKVITRLLAIVIFMQCIGMELEEHSGSDGCRNNGKTIRVSSSDLYSPYEPKITEQNKFNEMNRDDQWEHYDTLLSEYKNLLEQAKKIDLDKEREIRELKKQAQQKTAPWEIVVSTMFFTIFVLTLFQKKVILSDK